MHVEAEIPVRNVTAFTFFGLGLGLSIPCLAGREIGREQHQPHLCSDKKPLYALQGMSGGKEGGWWTDSGAHDDPKVNRRLDCVAGQSVGRWGEEC